MDRRTGVLARVPEAYYSEERQAIVETARAFAMKEVLPVANRLDPVQGEMPMGLRDIVTEELARAWMSVASLIARGNGIGAGFSEEKRREMLPKMARGECLGAFALSEPGAGSDVAAIRCRAELVGDQWVVNGQKMWCTFADGADFIILVARATPYDPEHRHAGIAQFLIEKERGTFPPGIAGTPMRKVGYHGWKTWELSFDNFRIPKENILLHAARSGSSEGFKRTAMALSVARIHTAARSVGLARGALEDSVAYAQTRVQFGRPIGDFQAIRFKLAWMATEVEAARALTYAAADDFDHGQRADVEASMAKLFASEMSEKVTSEGLQIHGGAGYTSEYPLERYWRDARLTKIFGPPAAHLRARLLRGLRGRPEDAPRARHDDRRGREPAPHEARDEHRRRSLQRAPDAGHALRATARLRARHRLGRDRSRDRGHRGERDRGAAP